MVTMLHHSCTIVRNIVNGTSSKLPMFQYDDVHEEQREEQQCEQRQLSDDVPSDVPSIVRDIVHDDVTNVVLYSVFDVVPAAVRDTLRDAVFDAVHDAVLAVVTAFVLVTLCAIVCAMWRRGEGGGARGWKGFVCVCVCGGVLRGRGVEAGPRDAPYQPNVSGGGRARGRGVGVIARVSAVVCGGGALSLRGGITICWKWAAEGARRESCARRWSGIGAGACGSRGSGEARRGAAFQRARGRPSIFR